MKYIEYEDDIYRLYDDSGVMQAKAERYERGAGYVPYPYVTDLLFFGRPISEKEAKEHIANLIMKRR